MRTVIVFLSLLVSLYLRGNERYYFSNLSLENGLSQITVGAILQDSKGYMWFGTRNGLNRYDGYDFDIFRSVEYDESSLSDNHVICMVEDHEQNLWIGTNNGLNKLKLSTLEFKRYLTTSDMTREIPHHTVLSIYFDENKHKIWIGTNKGLYLYDPESDNLENVFTDNLLNTHIDAITQKGNKLYLGVRFHGVIVYDIDTKEYIQYKHDDNLPQSIANDYIKAILIDNQDNLWIGTRDNGLSVLEKGDEEFYTYNQKSGLSNNYVRSLTETSDGKILVGTFNGLNVISHQTKEIEQYTNYGVGQGNLSHYSILTTYFDRAQTLWVGTYAGGVCYYNKSGEKFRFYNPSDPDNIMGIVGPMVEVNNQLYVATEGAGLLEMNKNTKTFSHHKIFAGIGKGYAKNIIKSLCFDKDRILCGTNMGTVYSFNLKTKKFTLFYDMKSEQSIYYLGSLYDGKLVIGGVSEKGLIIIDKDGTQRSSFPVKGKPDITFPDIRCFREIEENIFLIGTRNKGLYYYDMNNQIVKEFRNTTTNNIREIPENYITSILKDSSGNIWIGTFGGGISLFNLEFGEFITYNTKDGLHNDNVCAIVESDETHLWISTVSGLSEFDTSTKTFKNYTNSNGIKINEFTLHAGLKTAGNNIAFSGNNGFILFDPSKITFNTYTPPVVLRHLQINNNIIQPGDKDGILTELLDRQKSIELKYNESNITIEYSALNFIFSNKNQYTYILEGFDREWNEVGSRRVAYYTNVPPGEYKFRVKGSNNDNVWSNQEASLIIKISPPAWETWWAYCIYAILFSGVLFFIFRYFSEKKRLQNDIRLKQMEAKTQQEFYQARNKLFTNFSHELRTPLTLIMGPLENVMEKENLTQEGMRKMQLMQSNSRRLLRLVNNLMDFQKKESGTMQLKVSQGDFIQFTHEITTYFGELAQSRDITFSFYYTIDTIQSWYDKNLMEKVYFNLLSNAFKNVPNGGAITISVDCMSLDELTRNIPDKASRMTNNDIRYIIMEIKDSGVGISANELENIFIPFYQIAQNEHSSSGTGLGLSLSRSIIEMHHGVIWAESVEGEGTTFKCILPICRTCFKAEEIMTETPHYDSIFINKIDLPEIKQTSDDKKKKLYTILVVEDNPEVRQYIVSNLTDTYNIIEASNGQEGIEKAANHSPDLIISDLMMPKMNGMEMCMKIKNDLRTSHIPVIMLTAKTMADDIEKGYKTGADDYITKPFSTAVLRVRVENIIQSRIKLKELYGKRFTLDTLGVEVASTDELFLQKLYAIMEKNIANPELNLDGFSQDIGMSRTNLYRKIKALTNLSPGEFIRNFRLTMGAKMLKEAKLPVSDVYVAVGFNSHAYFSNCFKAFYGVSPTEYARQ